MDYITIFKEKHIQNNELYPRHDIGVARLFYDLHRLDVRRGGVGNIVVGVILDYTENPFD